MLSSGRGETSRLPAAGCLSSHPGLKSAFSFGRAGPVARRSPPFHRPGKPRGGRVAAYQAAARRRSPRRTRIGTSRRRSRSRKSVKALRPLRRSAFVIRSYLLNSTAPPGCDILKWPSAPESGREREQKIHASLRGFRFSALTGSHVGLTVNEIVQIVAETDVLVHARTSFPRFNDSILLDFGERKRKILQSSQIISYYFVQFNEAVLLRSERLRAII